MATSTYTYDDFMKKATDEGLWDSMSEADKVLAEKNPEAGMSILQYRLDYRNASTDDARALAHEGAERIRTQYGGYTGGDSGSGYYLTDPTPSAYEKANAPVYDGDYDEQIRKSLDAILNKDEYQSSYAQQIQDTINQITNGETFSYDAASDPLYQAYAKQYRREGKRAATDTLGNAASLTGGMPSSYAMTAASQSGDYYAAQLSDKLPELAEASYDRYLNQQSEKYNTLESLLTAENEDYQKYIDALGFDYDDLNTLLSLEKRDYERFKDQLSQYNTDRNFDYEQWLDDLYYRSEQAEISQGQANYEEELSLAKDETAAKSAQTSYENQLSKALYAAEYLGDYTLLKKLLGYS
jgi:hypothetical protein